MPHPKDNRQSLLTLKPASAVDDSQSDQLGILGTWNFDQEFIRKALARMLIVDELPFKFFEGYLKFHLDGYFLEIVTPSISMRGLSSNLYYKHNLIESALQLIHGLPFKD